mgnify:CR=1 FL=1
MSTVIIVGNGSSLLEKNNGKVIDEFDIVVRFNAFTIAGYEKHVGTKIDYWYNTINFLNKSEEPRLKNKYKKIVIHSWEWDPTKDKTYISFMEHCKDEDVIIEKTKRETIKEMQEFVDDYSYSSYSTGAIAVWMLLKEYEKVVITGFDWWNTDKHHYNDNAPRGTLHKPDKEYKFIMKLQKENKVIIL